MFGEMGWSAWSPDWYWPAASFRWTRRERHSRERESSSRCGRDGALGFDLLDRGGCVSVSCPPGRRKQIGLCHSQMTTRSEAPATVSLSQALHSDAHLPHLRDLKILRKPEDTKHFLPCSRCGALGLQWMIRCSTLIPHRAIPNEESWEMEVRSEDKALRRQSGGTKFATDVREKLKRTTCSEEIQEVGRAVKLLIMSQTARGKAQSARNRHWFGFAEEIARVGRGQG